MTQCVDLFISMFSIPRHALYFGTLKQAARALEETNVRSQFIRSYWRHAKGPFLRSLDAKVKLEQTGANTFHSRLVSASPIDPRLIWKH